MNPGQLSVAVGNFWRTVAGWPRPEISAAVQDRERRL